MYVEVDDVPETLVIVSHQLEESMEDNSEQQFNIRDHYIPTPILRRSSRPHVPNRKYINYILLTHEGKPKNYEEAYQTINAGKWEHAIKDEMKYLISN